MLGGEGKKQPDKKIDLLGQNMDTQIGLQQKHILKDDFTYVFFSIIVHQPYALRQYHCSKTLKLEKKNGDEKWSCGCRPKTQTDYAFCNINA